MGKCVLKMRGLVELLIVIDVEGKSASGLLWPLLRLTAEERIGRLLRKLRNKH